MNQTTKNQKRTTVVPTYRIFAKTAMFQDYKACSKCGQNEIPFKKGVCPRCSHQVGDVQYVRDSQEYVKSNYGHIRMGIREVYQGLDEK